jgi:DNA-binding transcriptional LysR family regulator
MEHTFEDNNLEFHELVRSTPFVFFHENHPLASKDRVTFQDLQLYPCIMYELNADSPSVLHEEFFITDFHPQKLTIINSLYQSIQVMTNCNGYDLGCGVISPSNRALGVVKRPVSGFDTPLSIGWIHRRSHALSPLAAEFVTYLEKFCLDV